MTCDANALDPINHHQQTKPLQVSACLLKLLLLLLRDSCAEPALALKQHML